MWFGTARYSFYEQGYTRDPAGNFTTFVAPGTGPTGNTDALSIDASGEVTGYAMAGRHRVAEDQLRFLAALLASK